MSKIVATLSVLVLSAVALGATSATAETEYQPYKLLGTGYRDHVDADGTWKLWGGSRDQEGGRMLALYRAAELADAQGIAVLRVIDQGIVVQQRRGGGMVSEIAHFSIRPVRSAADLSACAMRHADRCITLSVARILSAYGPPLHQRATPITPGLVSAGAGYGSPASPWQVQIASALRARADTWHAAEPARTLLPAPISEPAPAVDAPLDPYEAGRRAAAVALAGETEPR